MPSDGITHVTLLRHGESLAQSARALGQNRHDESFRDCHLSKKGAEQARRAWDGRPPPQLIVVSPLTRALATTLLCFHQFPTVPIVCHPLVMEAVTVEDCIPENMPRSLSELAADPQLCMHPAFGTIDFTMLGPEWPKDVFSTSPLSKVSSFLTWLSNRPEASIVVVSHYYTIRSLVNCDRVKNCVPLEYRLVRQKLIPISDAPDCPKQKEAAKNSHKGGRRLMTC